MSKFIADMLTSSCKHVFSCTVFFVYFFSYTFAVQLQMELQDRDSELVSVRGELEEAKKMERDGHNFLNVAQQENKDLKKKVTQLEGEREAR